MCDAFSIKKDNQEFEWKYKPDEQPDIDFITQQLYDNIIFNLERKINSEIQVFFDQKLNLFENEAIPIILEIINRETKIKTKEEWTIKLHERCCPFCSKKIGGRFDAVLQIRIQNEHDRPLLEKVMEFIYKTEDIEKLRDPKNFISKIEKTPNGPDLKLSTNTMLKIFYTELKKRFNFQTKRSIKLIKRDPTTGADILRQHVLVKLIPLRVGDMIQMENIRYIVKRFYENQICFEVDGSSETMRLKFSQFEKKKYSIIQRDDENDQI